MRSGMKRFEITMAIALAPLAGCSSDPPGSSGGGQLVDAASNDSANLEDATSADADAGAADSAPPFDGPPALSDTGLYADIASGALASGVLPYDVRYPLWSDGSDKQRYLWLPPGTTIDTSNMDWWKFPLGTKAWKQFSKDGTRIETRYLEKRFEGQGGWLEVSYVWNAAGTEAFPAPLGEPNALGTTHDVPSQDDCTQCHDGVGDVLIGVSAIQLGAPGGNGFLSTLTADGWLSAPPASEPEPPGTGVVQDALGYLHANCGQCHNDVHFLAQKRALRLRLLVSNTTPEETPAYQTAIGGKMNHILQGTTIAVVPGKPQESQLWLRMSYRDLDSMPPLGTEVVDSVGLATIESWIAGLSQ